MKVLFNHFQGSLHLPIQVHRFPSMARYSMSPAEPRPEVGQNGDLIALSENQLAR